MRETSANSRLAAAAEGFARHLLALADHAARRGADWLKDRRFAEEHARLLDELEEHGDFEALVELTGATREQLRASKLSPLAAFELFHRMVRRLGIDPAEVTNDAVAFTEAQWHCRLCTNWRACRRWLDADVPDQRYRDFCSNAALLERMRARLGIVPTPET
jgi:hypothetical protein